AGPEGRPVHRRRPALPKKPSPARPRPAPPCWCDSRPTSPACMRPWRGCAPSGTRSTGTRRRTAVGTAVRSTGASRSSRVRISFPPNGGGRSPGGPGRQEHRRVEVFAVADQLPPEWRGTIACAARVSRLSWCKDTRTGLWRPRREVAYYLSQVRLDAEDFGWAVRAHWGIENRDHHVRDRIRREDDSRIRRQPGIFARLRSFALNILRANGIGNVSEAIYTNALSLDRLLAHGLPKSQN